MSKFSDILKGVKIGAAVAKPFVPGGVGSILDTVTNTLGSHPGGEECSCTNCQAALKKLAADNDEQTQAIFALHQRLQKAGF